MNDGYDLHVHTCRSDGRLTPEAVVRRAADNGVRHLAITDHDTFSGLDAARASASGLVDLVPGIELSVTWARGTLHVVGLWVDPDNDALRVAVHDNDRERHTRAERIAGRLARSGLDGTLEGARAQTAPGAVPGRVHFARHLVERGAVGDVREAFKRFLRAGRPGAVASRWISLEAGVAAIRAAGGVAVLAHPLRYGLTATRLREATRAFREAGGEAVEVVCGGDGPGQRGSASALARRYGLAGSVGSDFHDPDQTWRDIGRLPPLPADITPVWSLRAEGEG